jgi:hypothetical protein
VAPVVLKVTPLTVTLPRAVTTPLLTAVTAELSLPFPSPPQALRATAVKRASGKKKNFFLFFMGFLLFAAVISYKNLADNRRLSSWRKLFYPDYRQSMA